MLSGRRPFPGDSRARGSLFGSRPRTGLECFAEDIPETVESLLRRCLAKDPKQRMHHIADARVELDHILSAPAGSVERCGNQAAPCCGIAGVAMLVVMAGIVALTIRIQCLLKRWAK